MKKVVFGGIILILLFVIAYLFLRSNMALLSDETCLKIASEDILGNPLYGKSCLRSSYVGSVENKHGSDKRGAAIFKFSPIQGKELQCPPVSIIVDRKTGEAWLRSE